MIGGPKTSNDLFPLCHHAGSENQFRLVLRRMRLDSEIASQLVPRGGNRGGVERMYRLMNGSDAIAPEQAMPSELIAEPDSYDLHDPKDVMRAREMLMERARTLLSMRSEADVDEMELERIEAEKMHRVLIEDHFPDPGKLIVDEPNATSVEELERIALAREYDDDDARSVSAYTLDQPESAVSETVEDATVEPIKQEWPQFRVGVYSDETMVLERPDELFGIDKAEFAVMVAFARTVGWLA